MSNLVAVGYLVAAVLFILGLKGLGRPRTAVRGNQLGALGMLVAVVVTLTDNAIISFGWIIAGAVIGAVIGVLAATRVQMTSMPELVAIFNGFGGAASVLVAAASFIETTDLGLDSVRLNSTAAVTALIGAVTFTGSAIAFTKLAEMLSWSGPAALRWVNVALALGAVACGIAMTMDPTNRTWLWLLVGIGGVLGITGVVNIGGADMPVVIALLNSLSGIAAASAGFVLDNTVLIIAGALVGASGLILTNIMCRAMNRTLPNVLSLIHI